MASVARKPRYYPRTKVTAMKAKAKRTIQQMAEIALATRLHRDSDPFEQAKLILQRRGIVVFEHRVIAPGSDLVVVGTRKMTRDAVVEFASRFAHA